MSRLSEALERVDQVIGERRRVSDSSQGSNAHQRPSFLKPGLLWVLGLIFVVAFAFFLKSKTGGIQLSSAKVSSVKIPSTPGQEKLAPRTEQKIAPAAEEIQRPSEKEDLYRQGAVAAQSEDYDRAESAYRRLVESEPNEAEAYNNLGVIYVRRGAVGKGIEALRSALRLSPDYPEATLNLAIALERQGEVAEAVQHYRRFLSLAGEKWKPERERIATHVGTLEKRKQ